MYSKKDSSEFLKQVLRDLSLKFSEEGHDSAYFERVVTPYFDAKNEELLLSLLDKDQELRLGQNPYKSQNFMLWLVIALKHPDLSHNTLFQCATKLEMPKHTLSYEAALLGNIEFFQYLMDKHQILEEQEYSNLGPAVYGAIKGNHIELLELLQKSRPEEFAKLNPEEFFERAIASGSMHMLEYLLQNFKASMPHLLQYKDNWLYHLAATSGQMEALKYLEAIALKEGGPEQVSKLRNHKDFGPFRFGAPNVQEYFLSDRTFYESIHSSEYFSRIPFPSRYELLQKAGLSEEEILEDEALSGNVEYFEYLTQTQHLLKDPKKAEKPFLLAAAHNHLSLLQFLHKQIPMDQIKQIIAADDYQIIKMLLHQQERYAGSSSMGRDWYSIKDPTEVLNWFQEIIPELKPKVESIAQANRESKKIQLKGKEIISSLRKACNSYQTHLLNQKEETQAGLLNKKKDIMAGLIKTLSDPEVKDPRSKIKQFKIELEKNISTLEEKRSSNWLQFIEIVAHILSLGLYSKLEKNTFQFWKSHGSVFSEKAQKILENKETGPSKKV